MEENTDNSKKQALIYTRAAASDQEETPISLRAQIELAKVGGKHVFIEETIQKLPTEDSKGTEGE